MNGWQVAILVAAYAPMLLLWAPALTDRSHRLLASAHNPITHWGSRLTARPPMIRSDYFVRFAR